MVRNGTSKLTTRQRRMIAALLSSRTNKEACEAAGVGHGTLYRWLDDRNFKAALAKAESEAIGEATRALIAGKDKALLVLEHTMISAVSESVRERAASNWFSHMQKMRELNALEERLTVLEQEVLHGK